MAYAFPTVEALYAWGKNQRPPMPVPTAHIKYYRGHRVPGAAGAGLVDPTPAQTAAFRARHPEIDWVQTDKNIALENYISVRNQGSFVHQLGDQLIGLAALAGAEYFAGPALTASAPAAPAAAVAAPAAAVAAPAAAVAAPAAAGTLTSAIGGVGLGDIATGLGAAVSIKQSVGKLKPAHAAQGSPAQAAQNMASTAQPGFLQRLIHYLRYAT